MASQCYQNMITRRRYPLILIAARLAEVGFDTAAVYAATIGRDELLVAVDLVDVAPDGAQDPDHDEPNHYRLAVDSASLGVLPGAVGLS